MLPYIKKMTVCNKPNRNPRILVIDDSLLVLKLIEKCLIKDNYSIMLARSASDALDIMDHITPDVILLDLLLPDIDGYNLLKLLKLRKQTEEIPIVIISALDRGIDISKGLKLGAYDYIIKPFTSMELKNKIVRAVKERDPFEFINA